MTRLDDLIARAQDLSRLPPPGQMRLAADLLEAGRDEGRATEALQAVQEILSYGLVRVSEMLEMLAR